MAGKGGALSVERAWNTVALEERLELISRSNAEGMVAAIGFVAFFGSVAYGFDEIWLLWASLIGALIISPLFASISWRRGKPELILKYLAARSVTRRYGYGSSIPDLDIVILFRGMMRDLYSSEEEASVLQQNEEVDLDNPQKGDREVWICLMVGGIIILSEKPGGAKLEMSVLVSPDLVLEKATDVEDAPPRALVLEGSGMSRGKRALLWSNSVGALYVFERKVAEFINESIKARERMLEQISAKGRK